MTCIRDLLSMEVQLALGWCGGPYVRVEPTTVFRIAGLRGRQAGLTSLVLPWLYRSNAQVRFEWGLLEVHQVR